MHKVLGTPPCALGGRQRLCVGMNEQANLQLNLTKFLLRPEKWMRTSAIKDLPLVRVLVENDP